MFGKGMKRLNSPANDSPANPAAAAATSGVACEEYYRVRLP